MARARPHPVEHQRGSDQQQRKLRGHEMRHRVENRAELGFGRKQRQDPDAPYEKQAVKTDDRGTGPSPFCGPRHARQQTRNRHRHHAIEASGVHVGPEDVLDDQDHQADHNHGGNVEI